MKRSIILAILAAATLVGCTSQPDYNPQTRNDSTPAAVRNAEVDIVPLEISEPEKPGGPRISLLNFNEGGKYFGGSKQVVMWKIEGEPGDWDMVEMFVSRDSGLDWYSIGRVRASKGQVVWTLPTTEGSGYRLKAKLMSETDTLAEWVGEEDFSITCGLPPCLPVVEGVSSGHTVSVGYVMAPRHTADERNLTAEEIAKVVLWVTSDNCATWRNVGAFPAGGKKINYTDKDGRYGFFCSYVISDGAWSAMPVKGTTPQATLIIDTTAPTLDIRSPAEGEEIQVPEKDWADGGRVHIVWDVWDANLDDEFVSIFVMQEGKEWRSLGKTPAESGVFETRLEPSDEPYRLKIIARDIAGNETVLKHNKGFRVIRRQTPRSDEPPTLILVRPVGGEVLRGGSDQTVSWKSAGLPESDAGIIVEYFDGQAWHSIRKLSDPCGTFVWRVPEENGADLRLRLRVDLKYKVLTVQSGLLTVDSTPPSVEILPGIVEIEERPAVSETLPDNAEPEQYAPERGARVGEAGSIIDTVIKIESSEEPGRGGTAPAETGAEKDGAVDATPEWHKIEKETERLAKRRMLDEVLEYIEDEQWTMAEVNLKTLENKYTDDAEVLYVKGRLYYEQNRYEEAIGCLSKAAAIDPHNAAAQYYLGKIALISKANSLTEKEVRFIKAETYFKEALKNDPEMAEAYNDLATLYFDRDDYKKALDNFGRAVDADPANKIYLYNYGRTAYQLKSYEDAIDFCLKAVKIDPNFPHPYWFIAKSYSSTKDWEEAVEYWQKVIDLFAFDTRLQAEAVRRLKEAQEKKRN